MNNLGLIQELAGVLFLVDLAWYLSYRRVVLGRGYWDRLPWSSPLGSAAFAAAWIAGCLSLILHVQPLLGALSLVVLFRLFYIRSRWTGLFRGGGAPGFMSHYLAVLIAVGCAAAALDASGRLSGTAELLFRVDFAVVLLCSGTYKSLSGYLHGEGMEYGLANPLWGHWHARFRRVRPSHPLLRLQDAAAALGQLTMGALMLVPGLRWLGGALCIAGFFGLLFLVRLGRLAVLMMVVPLIYLPELGWSATEGLGLASAVGPVGSPDALVVALQALMWAYLAVLVPVKVMQYLNLFLSRRYPRRIQDLLTRYANAVPIIMWRVFTPDVTNFFVRIYAPAADGGERRIVHEETTYDLRRVRRPLGWFLRFHSVTESIAVTTVFTTLKYFKSDRGLFERRLVRYARTLRIPPTILRPGDRRLRFEYVQIVKRPDRFAYVPIVSFHVDLDAGTVEEETLTPGYSYSAPAPHSHIKETVGFGSYVPA